MVSMIPLFEIRVDGGTQSRAALSQAVIDEYAETIRDGSDFPPVTVFHDGKEYWLADGFHRIEAYRKAGAIEIEADIRQGEKREAILFSVGANAAHGLRRTNDDKRRAVMTLLYDKEWSLWSDREIATQCRVSHTFVAKQRNDLTGNVASERTYTTKHGTEAKMDTANIGKSGKSEAAAGKRTRQVEHDAFREENRAKLAATNPRIASIEAAKARNGSVNAAVPSTDALQAEIAELREENAALRQDVADLRAELKKFAEMKAEYEKGGFEEVIRGKDEVIRAQATRIETESRDKVSWKRSADHWKAEAMKLGYTDREVIELNG